LSNESAVSITIRSSVVTAADQGNFFHAGGLYSPLQRTLLSFLAVEEAITGGITTGPPRSAIVQAPNDTIVAFEQHLLIPTIENGETEFFVALKRLLFLVVHAFSPFLSPCTEEIVQN
jgi:hypothetical protein